MNRSEYLEAVRRRDELLALQDRVSLDNGDEMELAQLLADTLEYEKEHGTESSDRRMVEERDDRR